MINQFIKSVVFAAMVLVIGWALSIVIAFSAVVACIGVALGLIDLPQDSATKVKSPPG